MRKNENNNRKNRNDDFCLCNEEIENQNIDIITV